MKIIITGATGFTGRNLAETFHREGHEIIATGRSIKHGEQLRSDGIEFRKADITAQNELDQTFSPADLVIHSAGRPGDIGSWDEYYSANVTGTRNVINACRKNSINRVIFISTPSIYFDNTDREDISEGDPLPRKQITHYAKTKLMAEKDLAAARSEGISSIVLRPRALYGPYENTFMPRFIRMSERNQFPIVNNGRAMIDITWIGNFADAVRCCFDAPESAWNQAYNIANDEPISIHDWISLTLEMAEREFRPKGIPEPVALTMAGLMEFTSWLSFGKRKPAITKFSVMYMARTMTMSIEKAKAHLGWSPRIGNREGFELYRDWKKSQQPEDQ